jgi:hypothetical protein
VTTTIALLKRRIHTVLLEAVAKLGENSERILVASVDGDPLAPLRGGVDGVKADGDLRSPLGGRPMETLVDSAP